MLCEFFYPFDRGGSEWSVFYLAKGLINTGHKVTICTPNYGSKKNDLYNLIRIYRFPFYIKLKKVYSTVTPLVFSTPIWWIYSGFFTVKAILKIKPNVIHVQGKYFLVAAIIAKLIFKVPIVVTLRDYIPLCPIGFCLSKYPYKSCNLGHFIFNEIPDYLRTYSSSANPIFLSVLIVTNIYAKIYSMFLVFLLKRVNKIVGISFALSSIYRKNSIDIDNVIYNSTDFFTPAKSIPKKYLLYLGRLTPGKGVDLLIRSYQLASDRYTIPKLLIVGDGILRTEIKKQKNVSLLGHVKHSSIRSLFRKAYLTIVPSVWQEPFGRVALESIAHRVPVAGTLRGGLPEIINNNKTGILVKPEISQLSNAIIQLYIQRKRFYFNIKQDYKNLRNKFEKKPIMEYSNIYEHLGN